MDMIYPYTWGIFFLVPLNPKQEDFKLAVSSFTDLVKTAYGIEDSFGNLQIPSTIRQSLRVLVVSYSNWVGSPYYSSALTTDEVVDINGVKYTGADYSYVDKSIQLVKDRITYTNELSLAQGNIIQSLLLDEFELVKLMAVGQLGFTGLYPEKRIDTTTEEFNNRLVYYDGVFSYSSSDRFNTKQYPSQGIDMNRRIEIIIWDNYKFGDKFLNINKGLDFAWVTVPQGIIHKI